DGTIYRVVQESVSNAVRHGSPTRVGIEIELAPDATILVRVTDDGGGLKSSARPGGYGIIGMSERVASLKGTLEVRNRPDGSGVIVEAKLPARTREPIDRLSKTQQEIALQ